ncbi:AbrB family transcriptional regulator [Methylopila henanensis]|uniref:AbrB family transcriptional regulator n=1 Tax=Methylopila henanensis TaxID=873516 RepID=A0ABW4K710_9HYPH
MATAGALAFFAAGLPAPWLVGSVVLTGAASLAGWIRPVPPRVRNAVLILLGVSLGSAVTPTTVAGVLMWPGSMAALGVAVAAMVAASYWVLRRGFGWDRPSAFYASPPGALTATLAIASDSSADMSKVAVVQVFRVFVLVAVVPVLAALGGAPLGAAPATPTGSPGTLLALIAAGAAGGLAAHLFRLPGGLMIGAFAVSATLHATGVTAAALPQAVALPCFVALGAIVGTRFAGLTPRIVLGLLKPSVASFLVASALALGFSLGVGWWLDLPIAQVFVAFAPGGLEAMMLMAYLLGLDPAYVGAHHVARFVAISFAVPLFARLAAPEADRPDGSQ